MIATCFPPGNSTVSDDYYNTSGNSTVPDDNYVILETRVTYDCHSITPGNSTVSDDYYLQQKQYSS